MLMNFEIWGNIVEYIKKTLYKAIFAYFSGLMGDIGDIEQNISKYNEIYRERAISLYILL